jgi:hypothetical protein
VVAFSSFTSSDTSRTRVAGHAGLVAGYEVVKAVPQNQRTALLIDTIAQQMQQSGDPNTRELATDLASVKTQLVNACAPGQGGGQHAT